MSANLLPEKIIRVAKRFLREILTWATMPNKKNLQRVFGRTACLGKDLFALRYSTLNKVVLDNFQKVRLDLWLAWINGADRPIPGAIESHMLRKDVYPFIKEQAKFLATQHQNFLYLLIDSFAELTDQKFTHKKEGWSFCCHLSDLALSENFNEIFECNGLLPISEIESVYRRFFDWFESEYPGKMVIFIHFPAKLDDRTVFKERAAEILKVMKGLEIIKPFIRNLTIDDDLVDWNESDRFPYHYSKSTNLAFISQWNQLEIHENS